MQKMKASISLSSKHILGGSYDIPELKEYHEMACEGEVDENEPAIELEEVTA